MKYAFAKACITPKLGSRLAGFNRTAPVQGVLDDLYLQVLLLEDGSKQQSIIISGEIIGFESSFVKKIRQYVVKKFPNIKASAICFNATHTHGGPATVYFVDAIGAYDSAYVKFLEKTLKNLLDEVLNAKAKNALIYGGKGNCNLSVNRRLPSGMGVNEKGSTDKNVSLIAIKSKEEEIFLINYACHPTIMQSSFISGDYPSAAMRALKAQSKLKREIIFLQGAGADLKPRCFSEDGKKFRYGNSFDVATIADMLVKAVNKIISNKMKPIKLNLNSSHCQIRLDYNTNEELKLPFLKGGKKIFNQRRKENSFGGVVVELQYWALSKNCKLVSLSGEICHQIGLNAKKILNCDLPLFLGYSNGLPGYIPTDTIIKEGGYEGHTSMQYYGHPHPIQLGAEKKIYDTLKKLM